MLNDKTLSKERKSFWFYIEGQKKKIKWKNIGRILLLAIAGILIFEVFSSNDDAFYAKKKLIQKRRKLNHLNVTITPFKRNQEVKIAKAQSEPLSKKTYKKVYRIFSMRPQVITREQDLKSDIRNQPMGTYSYIGTLLTSIDTRMLGRPVRVRISKLPKRHSGPINIGSTLIGHFLYPGSGNFVFVEFKSVVLKNGKTFNISGYAQEVGVREAGVKGVYYNNYNSKALLSMGLHFSAAASRSMKELQMIHNSTETEVIPRSHLRNATLEGIAGVIDEEAHTFSQEVEKARAFVKVRSQKRLLVHIGLEKKP